MIHEILQTGKANATTGRELAVILNCGIRDVTIQIESERRAEFQICANAAGINGGYFIAADEEELIEYCDKLKHRANELYKTRRILLNTLKKTADKKKQDQERNK